MLLAMNSRAGSARTTRHGTLGLGPVAIHWTNISCTRFCKDVDRFRLEVKKLSVLLRRAWDCSFKKLESPTLRCFFFAKMYKRLLDKVISDKSNSLDHARNLLKLAYLARQFQTLVPRSNHPKQLEKMVPEKLSQDLVSQAKPLIENNPEATLKDKHLATSWAWESHLRD